MKRTTVIGALLGALLLSAAAWGISAAVDTPPSLMARSDYDASKATIESESRQALDHCRDLDGQAKDVCRAEARADERVRKADVARARCGSEHGSDRLSCMRAAREEKAKALSEAKLTASAT